jgi:hypothetical protein
MKTTVYVTATGISIEMDDMLVKIESNSQLKFQRKMEQINQISELTKDLTEMALNSKQIKSKAFKPIIRICKKCGNQFIPIGQRQQYCSEACGMKRKSQKEKTLSKLKNKNLDPAEEAALQKTLAEIEANKKQPYKITD